MKTKKSPFYLKGGCKWIFICLETFFLQRCCSMTKMFPFYCNKRKLNPMEIFKYGDSMKTKARLTSHGFLKGFTLQLVSKKHYGFFLWMGLIYLTATEPVRKDSLLFTT